ncbi:hypothetical protein RVR_P2104 (plasmid) [Actinacidiphila reveromycinica]|uniref:Uncharacterized protein n=1 Tax=Actinacidiphila reveromycinica TaxID=659352 RepID=A0A7R6QF36_9ACTN|nr:hypothetical protein [Streptomyces sp. SN-593]BBG20782.1 hypothetical protein RVR_P2104 [Streptomyces sp. SN-593]
MTTPFSPVRPSAGLLATAAVWTWLDATPAGHIGFFLIAHPPARRAGEDPDGICASMCGLADALGLALPTEVLPDVGPRLLLGPTASVLLELDDCPFQMHAPVGATWARFVADGGPVVILTGLDPLTPCAPRPVVESYIATGLLTSRLFLGKTCIASGRPR